MNKPEPDAPREEAADVAYDLVRQPLSIAGFLVRLTARVWVTGLLLLAAAFGGISVNQLFQEQSQLQELREEPGPQAYAAVAYRRELERQVRAYEQDWSGETVPRPPARPRILEDIDLARPREVERGRRRGSDLEPISAPN